MIGGSEGLLDTNVFLHAQTHDEHSAECRRFLAAVEQGRVQARLEPLVLHERQQRLVGGPGGRRDAGSEQPHRCAHCVRELYRVGRLELDALVSRRYALEEINQGFALFQQGEVARGVVVFAQS